MTKKSIALVTHVGIKQGYDEDSSILISALMRRDVEPKSVGWDDGAVNWKEFDLCVIRSTWNYHFMPNKFLAWVNNTAQETRVLNPPSMINWNIHKSYLLRFQDVGIPVVPTIIVGQNQKVQLESIMASLDGNRIVIKPLISANSDRTLSVRSGEMEKGQAHLNDILRTGGAMVQPYLNSVETYGERSLVYLDGELSHSVRKLPNLAEVTSEGICKSEVKVSPETDEINVSKAIMGCLGEKPLYARIDLMRNGNNAPVLSELELIEPYLFLNLSEGSAERFADAIIKGL